MNRKEFDRTERKEVTKKDFENMFKTILNSKPPQPSENREPTEQELSEKWRLDRVKD